MDSQRIRRSNMPRTAGGKRPTAALARLQRERPQRRNRSARLRSRRMRPSLSPTDRTRSLTRALTCALAAYVPQSCGRAAKAAVEEEAAALTSGRAAPLHPRREQWRAKRRGDIIGTILGERAATAEGRPAMPFGSDLLQHGTAGAKVDEVGVCRRALGCEWGRVTSDLPANDLSTHGICTTTTQVCVLITTTHPARYRLHTRQKLCGGSCLRVVYEASTACAPSTASWFLHFSQHGAPTQRDRRSVLVLVGCSHRRTRRREKCC